MGSMWQSAIAANGEVKLWSERLGDSSLPAVLLVQGAGGQAPGWQDDLCEIFVANGRQVIRFDNRDSGLSTELSVDAVYTLHDLAADTTAVLDAWGLGSAHLIGVSMGGMIAQTVALDAPERVASLTSVSSTPHAFDPMSADPTPEMLELTMAMMDPPEDLEGRVELQVRLNRALAGSAFEFDEVENRELQRRLVARAWRPGGMMRQGAAAIESEDRLAALAQVEAPVLVVHGTVDPVMSITGAEEMIAAIPSCRSLIFDRVGHELPRATWSPLVEAAVALAE